MTTKPSKSVPIVALIAIAVICVGCGPPPNTYSPPPPPEVTVATPVTKPILRFFDENGETEAAEEAEVRSRVRGFIEEIKFEPGQEVEAGQVLYLIEPDTYEAEVRSAQAAVEAAEAAIGVAKANVKNAEADLAKATADLGREKRLLEGNAGSQADYDRALAANESAKAAIDSAKATVAASEAEKGNAEAVLAQAKLDLGYTTVMAPISGRITKTEIKLGNLVDNGTSLATVINRDRVFANFNIADRRLLEFQKEMRKEEMELRKQGKKLQETDWSQVKVLLRREIDIGFPFKGHLDYVDQSGVDADTGTLSLRAVFENETGVLLPGLFVTVRVPMEDTVDALMIPEMALSRDQQGLFALTIDNQNKVTQARVTVAERISGWAVIQSGLDENSQVIIEGLQRSFPGAEVTPTKVQLDIDPDKLLRGMAPMPSVDATSQDVAPEGGEENDEPSGDSPETTDAD